MKNNYPGIKNNSRNNCKRNEKRARLPSRLHKNVIFLRKTTVFKTKRQTMNF